MALLIPLSTHHSLARRLVLISLLWLLPALTAQALVLSWMFRDSVATVFDNKLDAILRALVANIEFQNGEFTTHASLGDPRFQQVYSGWYWQVAHADNIRLISRSLWDLSLPISLDHPVGQLIHRSIIGPQQQRLRLAEIDIRFPGQSDTVHVVVAGDLSELDTEVRRFNHLLILAVVLLGASLLVLLLVQIKLGLRPLRGLGQELAAVQTGHQSHLGNHYPQEIAPLTTTLNEVLAHNAEVVRRARTHVGNLAHGLKTPLTLLLAEARETPPDGERIRQQLQQMRRLVDWHLGRATVSAGREVFASRTPVTPVVTALVTTLSKVFAERELQISHTVAEDLAFAGEGQDLEEMLGNLMENACKWARQRIHIQSDSHAGQLCLLLDDDGPGLSEAEATIALQRGKRLDEHTPGSGLGLSIVADIAELYGGTLTLEQSPWGGLRAVLSLPQAARPLA